MDDKGRVAGWLFPHGQHKGLNMLNTDLWIQLSDRQDEKAMQWLHEKFQQFQLIEGNFGCLTRRMPEEHSVPSRPKTTLVLAV